MTPFQLLADPVRLRIVGLLASGRHPAGLIAQVAGAEFAISRSAVSHQLRVLRDAGAVIVDREESVRQYRLAPSWLASLDAAVDALHALWDERFGWPYGGEGMARPSSSPSAGPRAHRVGARRRFELSHWEDPEDDLDPEPANYIAYDKLDLDPD